MKRKLLSLAVAVAALALVPAAAQAITPHWYKNNVKQAAGSSLNVVTFGGAVDLEQVSGIGKIHCKGVGGGTIENPVGGAAGVGKSLASAFYNCVAPECEAKVKAETGFTGKGEVRTENLPVPQQPESSGKGQGGEGWSNKLFEGGAPNSVREAIGEPWSAFPAPSQAEGKTPPGMIRATILCTIPAIKLVAAEVPFEGELDPEIGEAASENLNGLSAAHPSVAKFSGESTGALHNQVPGTTGANTGTVKYLGYVAQEVITVKE